MSKKIYFQSIINHGGNQNKISFESELLIGKFKDFITYEFKEPQNNIMNRIEINKTKINIFVGSSTINLELNKIISVKYQTPNGILFLNSNLIYLNYNKDDIRFSYILLQEKEIIGKYLISLKIKKNKH